MKFSSVDTVTSNEQLVRLRIYEGVIPPEAGGAELIELYRKQAETAEARLREVLRRLTDTPPTTSNFAHTDRTCTPSDTRSAVSAESHTTDSQAAQEQGSS